MSIRTASQPAALILTTLLLTILLVSVFASIGCDLGTYENRAGELITPDESEGEKQSEAEDSPSNPKPTVETTKKPTDKKIEPWGGMKVETSGPPLEKSTQIVVLLHGYGTSAADLVPLAKSLAGKSRAFVFPAAPFELDSGGLTWISPNSTAGKSINSLQSLFTYLRSVQPDAEISVGGFSQGASMASMLVNSTPPISDIILFSPGLFLQDVSSATRKSPRVYISHGRQDDVLPFSDAQKIEQKLKQAGYKVRLSPFDGGHTIPAKALKEAKAQLDDAR